MKISGTPPSDIYPLSAGQVEMFPMNLIAEDCRRPAGSDSNDEGYLAGFGRSSFSMPKKRGPVMPEPHRQPNVFVVDDEEVIALSLAMILRYHGGFQARSFTRPLEALEAARVEAPDLLITDVVMPKLSGIELAIQMREHCPDCKVLLFSGQAATSHLLQAAQARGYDFELLAKPVNPADLLAKIQNLTQPAARLESIEKFQARG
ncbi:MAG: response regulator [Terracidiphilus sp.]